jgi:hypothetical protein
MKTTPSLALLAALFVSAFALTTATFAFTEVARGSLTLTTTGRVAYDSNLVGHASGQGDTVFTLAPTLNYNRAVGLGTISASAGVAINRYADLTAFDSEDLSASLRISLPTPDGARQQGGFSAGYTDKSDIDDTVGDRIRAKTWNAGFAGTYRAGPRVDLRGNFNYTDTTRDTYTDRTQWSAGLGFDYTDFLGGFGLEGDYRYSDTQSSSFLSIGAIDQTSHGVSSGLFYRFVNGLRASANAGYRWIKRGASETAAGKTSNNSMTFGLHLNGPFLPPSRFPKLTSSFSIGIEKGQTLGLNDNGSSTVVGGLGLSWQARERTALTVNLSRTQGLSTANESSVDNTVSLGLSQRIGDRTSLSASLGQDWSSYPVSHRSSRHTRGALNLGYSLNRHWQTGAAYALTFARGSGTARDYDRHLVSAFVSCTY